MIVPQTLYHLYNRGNNKQRIFFQERNYQYFKQKVLTELGEHVHFLAYCLMPNHFHFLLYTKEEMDQKIFSNGLRTLLSSYTRAIQKQENMTGSLFQQNTKYKEVVSDGYLLTCFHYIHQNPFKAGLVTKIEDWPHSSFNEYWKNSCGLCDTGLGKKALQLSADFYSDSYRAISEKQIRPIFE
jgi:putative transposase